MRVKFGICINDLGVDTRMYSIDDSYAKLKYYVECKLKYILGKCDELYLMGVRHVRLPNLLPPSYTREDFRQLLTELKTNHKFKLLCRKRLTYSFHMPYKFSVKDYIERCRTRQYVYDLNNLMNCLGVKKFSIVFHIKNLELTSNNKFLMMISKLPTRYRKSIVIENDEYNCDLVNCLKLSKLFRTPVVFDNLHNRLNGKYIVNSKLTGSVSKTWMYSDRPMKIHYSSYSGLSRNGHGDTIEIDEMYNILKEFKSSTNELIVMLEIKNYLQALECFRYRTESIFKWDDCFCLEI